MSRFALRQFWLLLGLALSSSALAQRAEFFNPPRPRVVRGVYLQCVTPTSIVVRWRTSSLTDTEVRYGFQPDLLEQAVLVPGLSREHLVRLDHLKSATRYYYSVGTGKHVLQSGTANWFSTAPPMPAQRPVQLWVIGDAGTGNSVQRAVRDAYFRWTGPHPTDLVLALGDNAYPSGTEWQYDRAFFDVYRDLFKHAVVWPTLGNHDARTSHSERETGPYYRLFSPPAFAEAGGTGSGTAAYYAFDYANIHFLCLNSEDADLSEHGPMLQWLKRDLEGEQQEWLIAYWHQPPYSKGSHDSDAALSRDNHMPLMRARVLPLLEAAGADLVLCGHSHVYERSYLLHGHYGDSATFRPSMLQDRGNGHPPVAYRKAAGKGHPGTIYVNTGSAGHATKTSQLHGLDHPAMCVSLDVPGSLVLNILGQRLVSHFIDEHGKELDTFAIERTTE